MADTPQGETVVQEPPKNDVTPVAAPAPQQDNSNDKSEVEKLKEELKLAQQKAMRVGQVENELERMKKAEDERKSKQLEEQEQWKELAEQEKAKREALETERLEAETREKLRLAQETIFAEFSPEAIEVAQEAGLSLTEDSDEAKANLKSKLEKISQKVITGNKVTANNPGEQPQNEDRAQQVQEMRMGNKEARDKVIGNLKVLDTMRAQAGYVKQQ